jgi:TolB-like protein
MKNLVTLFCAVLMACACTVVDRTREARIDPAAKWALLPIVNHTETPQAGLRAEAITEAVLRGMGVTQLERYPSSMNPEGLFDPAERKAQDQAVVWAKGQKARYALSGSVEEWRYKVGVDGEPAVGLSLTIVDLDSGAVVYSAAGGKSGWSREALSAVAQKLARELLSGVQLGR